MTTDNTPLDIVKGAMQLGTYLGVYNIVKFFVMVAAPESNLNALLSNVLTLAVPVIAYRLMKRYRDSIEITPKLNVTTMWTFGTLLFLFSAMLSGIVEYVYYEFLNPEFLSSQMTNAINLLTNTELGISSEVTSTLKDSFDSQGVPSSIDMVVQTIWVNTILGAFLSLFLSLLVCRKRGESTNHLKQN